jgi:sugar phosphate isomerase/epimerase
MYSLSTCWNSGRHTCGKEMLREIRSLGFEYAELSHGIRISLVPGILEAVDAGEIKISTLHNFCPLPIGVNHAAPNLFLFSSTDRRERENAWRHSVKTVEMAQRVGAKLIVLHSGAVDMKHFQDKMEAMVAAGLRDTPKYRKLVEEMETKREKRMGEAVEQSQEMIRRLAEVAGEAGLLLGIENRESVEEIPADHMISEFLEALPENVRYWHDCGHAQIKENLGMIQHRLHLENLAPRLAGFHIHDVVEDKEGQHDHFPPGSGMIDFKGLSTIANAGHIKVVELSPAVPAPAVAEGLAFIKGVWGPE